MLRFFLTALLLLGLSSFIISCSDDDDQNADSPDTLTTPETREMTDSEVSDGPQPVESDGGDGSSPSDGPLAGTRWVWERDSRYTLEFIDNTTVAGMLECNSFFASYTASDRGELRISPELGTTLVACEEVSSADRENYVGLLRAVESYEINGDTLRLSGGILSTNFRAN